MSSREIISLTQTLDEQANLSSAQSHVDQPVLVRRLVFSALAAASIAALLVLAGLALSAGGFDRVDLLLLALFGVTTPWLVVGFWNAAIGFFIMRFVRDPSAYVVPQAGRALPPSAIVASTALLMCVRNEPPDRTIRNLEAMMADIEAAGCADLFHVYVLSDTGLADIASAEAAAFAALASRWAGRLPVTYRRRETNTGYKAGNIRDFLERWGDAHDLMVTLDADSYMAASAILRMVGIVQANPTLGILQGLVVGLPSTSAFARVFQFGMRLGMRSWTIGSAWWQADCGPYWGHNAVIRIAPFKQHCAIPALPGKGILRGHVLSHDFVEAALMRHEAVLEAAVVGKLEDGLTRTLAYVVLKSGAGDDALAESLKAFVKAELAPHKYPREIRFIAELPKTATGKIQRFKLREAANG